MASNRRPVLKLGVVDFGVETATLPGGLQVDLPVIRHPGGGAMVAMYPGMTVALLRQYRHTIGGFMREIPAGCRNAGEDPLTCARRELGEEAQVAAARWDHLGSIITVPTFFDQRIERYLAGELSAGEGKLDHDEVITVSRVPFEETFAMIRRGDIVDAKSIVALYRTRDFLEQERRG